MRTLLIAIAVSLIACASAWATTPVALSPAELTPAEAATYQTLKDEAAQKNFLDTRGYYRLCQKELSGEMPALDLPNMPRVTEAEQKIVKDALMKSLNAEIEAEEAKH